MCQMVWKSSSSVVEMGRTFWSTFLYLRTRVVGLMGRSGGMLWDVETVCVGEGVRGVVVFRCKLETAAGLTGGRKFEVMVA